LAYKTSMHLTRLEYLSLGVITIVADLFIV
jgi:hypothetical protein